MKFSVLAGSTNESVNVLIQDSSDGSGKTGLVYNTSGLTACYVFARSAPVAITLATLASVTAAYSSGGFKEIDDTECPGLYRLDLPNAAIAASHGRFVDVYIKGTDITPCVSEIELTGWDNQVSMGSFIADLINGIWSVDMADIIGAAARSPLNAIRFLRNKWFISGTTLSVCEENDSSVAWTASVSTDAGGLPVVGNDPT